MAKSKSASNQSARKGASARGASRRKSPSPRVGKGQLEVGDRRRDTGGDVKAAARRVPRAAAKRPRGNTSLQLPDEKAVRPTGATVPVEPARPAPGEREPLPAAAVDRRRQVVGTDDQPRRGGR